jgi:hypothetical protein
MFSKNSFTPSFVEKAKFIMDKNIMERCHKKFMISYIMNYSLIFYIRNIFLVSLIFFCFNYSLVVNKGDLITADGKNIMFYEIVRHGLYILIFLTVVYYICFDFILPRSERRIRWINEITYNTMVLLDTANKMYFNKNLEGSLYYYKEYLNIIEDDEAAMERIRIIRNTMYTNDFEKNKKINVEEPPDTTTDYFKLADRYYEKKDYYSAWYYYNYIAHNDNIRKQEAAEKIKNIKKIIQYENSMKTDKEKLSMADLMKFIDDKDREIQSIYLLKNKAKNLFDDKEYQKSYFVYSDILKINPNLRDVIEDQNQVYKKLSEISVEISYADKVKLLPGKINFVFTKDNYRLFQFGRIVKTFDSYYLYNVKIVDFDKNYNIRNVIISPYGRTIEVKNIKNKNIEKISNKITLYSYMMDNKNIEYKPRIFDMTNLTNEEYPEYLIDLPANLEVFYDFSYDYNKTLGFSLVKLFMLKNMVMEDKKALSIGLNLDFIKTAILDKISRIFLFFSICLIFIGLAWRLKSYYMGHIPLSHFILMLAVPISLYYFLQVFNILNSTFYSLLILIGDFNMVLIITFAVNILIMIASILFVASSK